MKRIHSALNGLFFNLRNSIKWRNKYWKTSLPADIAEIDRGWAETVLDTGARIIAGERPDWKERLPDRPRLVDVGSKSFLYCDAFVEFYRKHELSEPFEGYVTGIEIDAYRVMRDLKSRYDYALEAVSKFPGVSYHPGDFLEYDGKFDIVTMLFPFVTREAAIAWGMPEEILDPQRLYSHAWNSLPSGGMLMACNHGDRERGIADGILSSLGAKHVWSDGFKLRLWSDRIYLAVAQKD